MDNSTIPDEIKQKINDTMFMTGGDTDYEKKIFRVGAEFGYELASQRIQELEKENERLKMMIDGYQQIEDIKKNYNL